MRHLVSPITTTFAFGPYGEVSDLASNPHRFMPLVVSVPGATRSSDELTWTTAPEMTLPCASLIR